MAKARLIYATSTDIGKTYFVCQLIKKLRSNNEKVMAIKPVISGFEFDDDKNDSALILKSLDLKKNIENFDKISPFRLKYPFSPIKAAKMEGKILNFDEITYFCRQNIELADKNNYNILIEGAGGVMSPVCDKANFLDLAEKLQIPIILISGVYLGAISNVLCATEAIKSRNLEIEAIIVNKYSDNGQNLEEVDIIDEIKLFLNGVKCFSLDNYLRNEI